jgi:hypothetical protein
MVMSKSSNTTLDTSTQSLTCESPENAGANLSERLTEVSVPRKRRRGLLLTLSTILVISSMLLFPLLLLPSLAQAEFVFPSVGSMSFTSSGQFNPTTTTGLNDGVMLSLRSIPNPPSGTSYYLWLLPDQQDDESIPPLLVGTVFSLKSGNTSVSFTVSDHQNLLSQYSVVLITEQKANSAPLVPSLDHQEWRYLGRIPNTPTPGDPHHYSLLDHIRHLDAADPTLTQNGLAGGLSIWLYRNTEKVLEWATAARDGWTGNEMQQSDLIHRHMLRVLDALDGITYASQDVPPDSPFLADPQDSHFGLLSLSPTQDPSGLLPHIELHVKGLITSPGVDPSQEQLAQALIPALDAVALHQQAVRVDAKKLVVMTNAELTSSSALDLMNDLVTNATDAYVGESDVATGTTVGGVSWICGQTAMLAMVPIMPFQGV